MQMAPAPDGRPHEVYKWREGTCQCARFFVGPMWSVMVSPLGRRGRMPDLS